MQAAWPPQPLVGPSPCASWLPACPARRGSTPVLPQLMPASPWPTAVPCWKLQLLPAQAASLCPPRPMGRAPCREAGPGSHHLEPSVAAHVCSPILNHSRSIKCHCCKPRQALPKGLPDHLREPSSSARSQEEGVAGGRKGSAPGSRPRSS